MKPCADFQQRTHTSVNLRAPASRFRDPRENLQQRALACAVPADDADYFAGRDLERDIVERPNVTIMISVGLPVAVARHAREASKRSRGSVANHVAQRGVLFLCCADAILLAQSLATNGEVRHQTMSANCCSMRRK